MPPARARWGKGEAAGRPLGPAEPRCAHGGEVGAGGRGRAAGLRWGKNAFPSFAFSSRSVFLRRVPARVPTGTGTARLESPGLSRESCGGVPGAGRGALEQGRPGTFPAIFFSCLSVCLSRPKSGSAKLALPLQGGFVLRLGFRAGTGTRVGQSHRHGRATGGGPGVRGFGSTAGNPISTRGDAGIPRPGQAGIQPRLSTCRARCDGTGGGCARGTARVRVPAGVRWSRESGLVKPRRFPSGGGAGGARVHRLQPAGRRCVFPGCRDR